MATRRRPAISGLTNTAARRPIDPAVLIIIRWLALAGQLFALLIVSVSLQFDLPFAEAIGVIGVSAAVNLWQMRVTGFSRYHQTRLPVLLALGFDVVQLAALLYLTGGLVNPFAIFFLAPVVVSAALLDIRSTAILLMLVVALSSLLTVYHLPLPWGGSRFDVPDLYQFGLWAALLLSSLFIALYVLWLATDARRADQALAEAQMKLDQDRQSSAVGALATAAAHKLGSPLNTITLISHELKADAQPEDPHFEDIQLLAQEVDRCRLILAGLDTDARRSETILLPVGHVIQTMISRKSEDIDKQLHFEINSPADSDGPLLAEMPELAYALDTLIDNAADFARNQIWLTVNWDEDALYLQLRDDGPGLRAQTLNRIGEPGNSTRKGQAGHKGLGIFLASDLIRQLGGHAQFGNHLEGGAQIDIRLPWGNLLPGGNSLPAQDAETGPIEGRSK